MPAASELVLSDDPRRRVNAAKAQLGCYRGIAADGDHEDT